MDIWPYLGIVVLLAFSAFFSGSEIAYASMNRSKIKKAADGGNPYAKKAMYIYEHFDDMLSAILIGNNLVNIAASSIATVIAIHWMGESGTVPVVIVMTILILIFGEVAPKMVAKQQCDRFVLLLSYPLRFLMFIMKLVVTLVVWIVNQVSKLWTRNVPEQPSVTEDDLVSVIESVKNDGIIDEQKSTLLQSALEFSDISVQEILTPRTDMVAIDVDDDMDTIIETVLNSPYSRIPVYQDSIDNIIGILYLDSFLKELLDTEEIDIRSMLIEACFIPKTVKLPAVFNELQSRRLQMAIVTDEYGGTMGCITMEDVLEQLVGDIWDESDEIIRDFICVGENSYELSGDLSIHDFVEYLDLNEQDFESHYTTVGGWAIEMLNRFPNLFDSFVYKNLIVTVIGLDGLRVTVLSVKIIPEEESRAGEILLQT
jgi:putative hemolysin